MAKIRAPSPQGKPDKSEKKKYLDQIGGKFAERYSITLVAPSVVPNYYPTLRIIEYNISGLEDMQMPHSYRSAGAATPDQVSTVDAEDWDNDNNYSDDVEAAKKKKKHKKGPRKYKFKVPEGPSKSTPPGPAYSPQVLSWTRYIQYFANLTHINNDFVENNGTTSVNQESPRTIFGLNVTADGRLESTGWKEGKHGKHQGKQPRPEPHPNEFVFEIEYDTKRDRKFPDMTVRHWVEYARKIGHTNSKKASVEEYTEEEEEDDLDDALDNEDDEMSEDEDIEDEDDVKDLGKDKGGKKHKKKKGKKRKHHKASKEWYTFVKRAFVSTMNPHDIKQLFITGPATNKAEAKQEVMEL